jgi:putative addiction module killer protein
MQVVAREVRNYITPEGRNPFRQWLTQLQDKRTRANIQRRIARLQEGNFGDFRRLNRDLYELRINYGPGYRVYFGILASHVVILLCGGQKGTQQRDITRAQNYWNEIRSRNNERGNYT